MADELAKERNLPKVAGSDAHKPKEMWAAYTVVDAKIDPGDVLRTIKGGLVKVKTSSRRV